MPIGRRHAEISAQILRHCIPFGTRTRQQQVITYLYFQQHSCFSPKSDCTWHKNCHCYRHDVSDGALNHSEKETEMASATGFTAEDLKEAGLTPWKDGVGTARCSRCGGFMVAEWCFDLLDDTGHLNFLASRCVQCGDLVDPVILRNRRLRPPFNLRTN